jgi:hypothetical protein
MKVVILLCALLTLPINLSGCRSLEAQELQPGTQPAVKKPRQSLEWHAATYRGLTVGMAKRTDVLRIFGQPKRRDTPADQMDDEPNPEEWYVYDVGSEFPGDMTVVMDKHSGTVLRIDLSPHNLPIKEAIKHFGNDYITTRYDFDQCLGNEESAPLFETPNGQFIVIEYRERGIAVGLDNSGTVGGINYVSKPIGTPYSLCNQSNK